MSGSEWNDRNGRKRQTCTLDESSLQKKCFGVFVRWMLDFLHKFPLASLYVF